VLCLLMPMSATGVTPMQVATASRVTYGSMSKNGSGVPAPLYSIYPFSLSSFGGRKRGDRYYVCGLSGAGLTSLYIHKTNARSARALMRRSRKEKNLMTEIRGVHGNDVHPGCADFFRTIPVASAQEFSIGIRVRSAAALPRNGRRHGGPSSSQIPPVRGRALS
jgi:hypothetical protein